MNHKRTIRVALLILVGAAGHLFGQDTQAPAAPAAPAQTSPTPTTQPDRAPTDQVDMVPLVVSAGLRAEEVTNLGVTVIPITAEELRASLATSVTEILTENSIGFFSQWTPAQSSIVLRGATSNPQGREDGSQVAVLINGRRTGTANISKLSTALAHQIEILKGPASVLYGNNAIGGVVNIITPTGATAPGYRARAAYGSWNFMEGLASAGGAEDGFDYFVAVHGAKQDDYHSGRNSFERPMLNTKFERAGGLVSIGYTFEEGIRIGGLYLNDGTYNTGFRGSAFNIYNYDNRTNQSIELSVDNLSAVAPDLRWQTQLFYVEDKDEFLWGNQIRGTLARDTNIRRNELFGLKTSLDFTPWEEALLLVGADLTYGELRSDRRQLTTDGRYIFNVRPQDVNADSTNAALFAELQQELLDNRLLLRGGLRYDYFEDSVVASPGYPASIADNKFDYHSLIYSASALYRVTDNVSVRGGISTGFSRPRPTDRVGNFLSFAQSPVLPNPDLKPEKSLGLELGVRYQDNWFDSDFALFSTRIDRALYPNRWEVPGSVFTDNLKETLVQGFEWRNVVNVAEIIGEPTYIFDVFANLNHNFTLENKDPGFREFFGSNKAWRTYETQANFGFKVGQPQSWDFHWNTIYNGHFWWSTEERISGMPPRTVNRYPTFWLTNLRVRYFFMEDGFVFLGVNNLFDENASPVFLARNVDPPISDPAFRNGGVGNSMPGRQFVVGVDIRF